MRRYGRYRYGPRFSRLWRPFHGAIWLIGLGILFLFGHFWPGILLLIGISMILEAVFRGSASQWPQNPPPAPMPFPPPTAPTPAPAPVASIHRVDLLPANCPQCGGPLRSYEVKWTGAQSAACPFCGSNLPMKKQ